MGNAIDECRAGLVTNIIVTSPAHIKVKLSTSPHPLFAQIEPFAASAVVAQMPIASDADFAHETGLPESFLKTMLYAYGE